jgi:hypothetical protein
MSEKPTDPAQGTVDQQKSATESYEGQRGYGVEYEDGRYRSENMQDTPERGRSGSYEEQNTGGYGTGQPDADRVRHADEAPVAPTDPEAQQGQGGR